MNDLTKSVRLESSHPALRADTAQFIGHIIAHLDYQLRTARRGEVDLGRPEEAAEQAILYIRAHAADFIEWGR